MKTKTVWKDWAEVHKMIGERVLVEFSCGHIEDATIHEDVEGSPIYCLFDGETITDEPVRFTEIPN